MLPSIILKNGKFISLFISASLFYVSCAGGGLRPSLRGPIIGSSSSSDEVENEADESVSVSSSKRTLTFSSSNNPLVSNRLNRKEARRYARELSASIVRKKGDKRKLMEASTVANALAGSSFSRVLSSARRLAKEELSMDINSSLSDHAKLQLALAAYQTSRYTMNEHFSASLLDSNKKRIKAAIYTMDGVQAEKEGRYPEAIALWKKALAQDRSYKPASLNIAFLNLRYGNFKAARKHLVSLQDDWFGLYGLLVAERGLGKVAKASSICNQLLAKKPNYKPALLTCALNLYQGKKDYQGAKKMIRRLLDKKGGSSRVDEKAYIVLSKIDAQMAKEKRKKQGKGARKSGPKKSKR